ncbi:GTPase IMAP family member 8-like [Thunnus albacares]|uniref:GTPase IMAP family member 8-like n=1 Tax=Thunnus albacares TaxID=8236 RepID=UPI001CF6730D|nr:GTPase IMAP family member 8-like [Thunnus albacares]
MHYHQAKDSVSQSCIKHDILSSFLVFGPNINCHFVLCLLGEKEGITLAEIRLVLIGGRWAGKSLSGNTILRKERFECGRARTTQCEGRHEVVEGRKLTVVDVPGWSSSLSLTEIPEGEKQRFKLSASKCPPGPNAFLLVIPIDCAFSVEQRRTVEEHMKLLGQRVWRYTMVLFTCGDFLGEKTIVQHIESEGDALKWLIERCNNRYHVFNNKKSNSSQVTQLLEKIDEMVWNNNGGYYELDEQTFYIIKEKQREVAEKAEKRRRKAEEQRQKVKALIPEEMKSIPKLQVILLGSRSVGKTSIGNAIVGIKEQEDGRRTAHSVARRGVVGKTEITLVDTPGWWKGFPVFDTPEMIKEEVMRSMFLCPPGPHVFLLVIDADVSFNAKHLDAVTTHMNLLGEGVWRHTTVVFTRGDWLGSNTIEEYIEGEGEALQSLVDQCGNRYHVIDNKNADDGTQITELVEKITGTVAENGWEHFVPDEQILLTIVERRKRVEEGARLRQSQVKAKRKTLRGSRNKLQELRIVMLGQKTFGKSATGNNLLRKEVFTTCQSEQCQIGEADVAGRLITVIDTPGWWKEPSRCTEEIDKEIVRGLTLSPLGVHVVLLVVPLDMTFREVQQVALEEHMNLFDAGVWKHAMVLFTCGDKLADRSIEEHIEREHSALQWLVDKCENRYHVLNNMRKTDMSEVTELFEKIEEMVSGNSGRLFCPDMNDIHLRIEEKIRRRQLKHVLKQRLEQEYRRRELELMMGFKEKLLELQADIRGIQVTSTKPKSLSEYYAVMGMKLLLFSLHKYSFVLILCLDYPLLVGDMAKIKAKGIGQRKKEENIDAKLTQEIEKLDKEIMKSTVLLRSSKDILLPSFSGDSKAPSIAESSTRKMSTSNFDRVLGWLSTLQIGTNVENELTINSSGYRSVRSHDEFDCDREADIAE